MTNQENINTLGKHFENFNDRMQTDMLFNNCMRMLIEGNVDVYGLIDVLIDQHKQLSSVDNEA